MMWDIYSKFAKTKSGKIAQTLFFVSIFCAWLTLLLDVLKSNPLSTFAFNVLLLLDIICLIGCIVLSAHAIFRQKEGAKSVYAIFILGLIMAYFLLRRVFALL